MLVIIEIEPFNGGVDEEDGGLGKVRKISFYASRCARLRSEHSINEGSSESFTLIWAFSTFLPNTIWNSSLPLQSSGVLPAHGEK